MSQDKFNIETIKEGTGPQPKQGQTVEVHYTGTFADGSKFDSSRDRNQTFKFRLGAGQVIQCWDKGLSQMRQGQRAKLTCPYNLAYGEFGYPGVIPPKATLYFDVELINSQ